MSLLAALMMFTSSWYIFSNQDLVESWVSSDSHGEEDWEPFTLTFQQDERWLVIVVDFTDRPTNQGLDVSAAEDLLLGAHGFITYHEQLRAGQGSISFDFHPTVIHAAGTEASYGADGGGHRDVGVDTGGAAGLAVEVLLKADSQNVDWSRYDLDSDGDVDRVLILHTGGVQEDGGNPNTIWSHFGFLEDEQELNGSTIGAYSMSGIRSEIGTVIHEMLHSYSAVDLYAVHDDAASDPWKGVGDFDIMASGNWAETQSGSSQPVLPMAASMELMGILRHNTIGTNEIVVGDSLEITMQPMSQGGDSTRIKLADGEYIWLEYRTRINADVGLPGDGLLVSIQDLSVGNVTLNNVNRMSTNPWLMILEADRNGDLISGSNNGEASDMFVQGESFGNTGVEVRNRDGVLVPWFIEITEQTSQSITLSLRMVSQPLITVEIAHNPIELLDNELPQMMISAEQTCLLEGELLSSDGRQLFVGPTLIFEGVSIIQGIWSSNQTDESNGNLDGTLSCDGIVQLDWFFKWNIVGNRILTTTHSDNIHWQQPEEVEIPLLYTGDGNRTYELEYVGPLERIVKGPNEVTLSSDIPLVIQIDPQGLLTPGMYARGEIVMHDGLFEQRIEVVLRAELIEGQSSVADWIGGPSQLLSISLGLAGLWFLIGIRGRNPPESPPLLEQYPHQAADHMMQHSMGTNHDEIW